MNINHDSRWEKIAGKLHGELSAQEEIEFSELMAERSYLSEFEKAQKIMEHLNKTGPVTDHGRIESWRSIDKGIHFYQLRWFRTTL